MQQNEAVICEIKRHPIGLLGINITAGLFILALAVVLFGVLPNTLTDVTTSKIISLGGLAFVVVTAILFIFIFIAHKVYWGNRWVLTSDSITQVTQTSLFNKQSSQLSLANLEDVTAEQNGIISHMFNFGLLKVETAGEHSKFVFPYCPNPNYYAQCVLKAREEFEQGLRESDK